MIKLLKHTKLNIMLVFTEKNGISRLELVFKFNFREKEYTENAYKMGIGNPRPIISF